MSRNKKSDNSSGPSHNMATAQFPRETAGQEVSPWGKRRGNSISSKGLNSYQSQDIELRDHYAAAALQGLLANGKKDEAKVVEQAFKIADQMLAQRKL
jgi:hypothetical protein